MKHDQIRRPITFPVLTRQQAEELEKLRQSHSTDTLLYELSTRQDEVFSSDLVKLDDEKVAIALLAGYDIERTAEEQIADLYKLGHLKGAALGRQYQDGIVAAWRVLRKDEPFPYHSVIEINDGHKPDGEL